MNLTLQTIASPMMSEVLASTDIDGIVLDTEHGHFNNETLYSCIQVITLLGKKCFVRVTDLNKQLVRMCLDAGVTGIIFSTVNDSKYGAEIVEFCRYPAHGGVRGSGLVRENLWGKKPLSVSTPILIAQIETAEAVTNLDSIMACGGFDYYIVGPYDLSASLGCTAQWDNEKYQLHIQEIYRKVTLERLGMFLPTQKDIDAFAKSNNARPHIVVWGMDTDFLIKGINSINKTVW